MLLADLCGIGCVRRLQQGNMRTKHVGGQTRWFQLLDGFIARASYIGRCTNPVSADFSDIKPHNFVIDANAHLMLTDFGSAAALEWPNYSFVARQSCLLPVGTPDYIAPEVLVLAENAVIQTFDDPPVPGSEVLTYGTEVDWWSLGATIYEMITTRPPFFASTLKETYDLIIGIDVSFASWMA